MRGLFTTMFALSLIPLAVAQDPDPPSRAARLSYINGSVSFQPGGVDDWVPATPNRPMTTGDRLWSDDGSRAEMNLGSAEFRLGSRSNFTFLNLDDRTAQVQISVGSLNVRLRRLADDETVEIDTPQVAFTLLRPGEYRIDVDEAGDATILTVRGGDGEASANGQAFAVHAREQVRIAGPEGADPIVDRNAAPPPIRSICSAKVATGGRICPFRRAMFRMTCPAMRISTPMERGARILNMERSGFPTALSSDGRPITMDTGRGSDPGAGRGSMTRRGATRPFIMAAGRWSDLLGDGFQDRSRREPFMLRRWLRSWAARASAQRSRLAGEGRLSAGSRSDRVTSGCLPIR